MLYTVKQLSSLSNTTVKTLHHYHKIGLLVPCEITEAGYRLYGRNELERLQQILIYRELDFTLEQIGQLLAEETNRSTILAKQEELLLLRKQRMETIIETLKQTIAYETGGVQMDDQALFKGFESEEAWREALKEQNEHLQQTYGYDQLESAVIGIERMNDMAAEATAFMSGMAGALRAGVKHQDKSVQELIRSHLLFLNKHGHAISASDYAVQSRFFLNDDFHLRMLESQQTGLAYYIAAAADAYAANERENN